MPELFIATKKDWKRHKVIRKQEPPRGRIPDGLTERESMERKLLTKRVKRLYSKRGQMIEAVFGQTKEVRRMSRFTRRGLSACASEWKLMCATHNLLSFSEVERHAGYKNEHLLHLHKEECNSI